MQLFLKIFIIIFLISKLLKLIILLLNLKNFFVNNKELIQNLAKMNI